MSLTKHSSDTDDAPKPPSFESWSDCFKLMDEHPVSSAFDLDRQNSVLDDNGPNNDTLSTI